MKALILAGGRGKRLNEQSADMNKCMLPVNGRPVIEYSLDSAVATETDEIVIVVGYRAEDIINYLGNSYKGKKIRYVIQWEQRGLVHAMESAKSSLEGQDFLLMLGDEILINPRHQQMIEKFKVESTFGYCGVLFVEDKEYIRKTYTIIQDEEKTIYRLVEKPRHPLNNYMGTGDCVFSNKILDYIDVTPIHHERSEKELPDLIQCAIDDGKIVRSFIICDKYTNINSETEIREAENLFENRKN